MALRGKISVAMFASLRVPPSLTGDLAAGLVVVAIAFAISGILRQLINRFRESKHLAPLMAGRLQRFRRLTIFSLTVLILMQVLGVFGGAWAMISAGLAAVAIGFIATWSMLSNTTAAMLILVFCPFRLGDTVELLEANGTAVGGRVVDINLMYTTLKPESQAGEQAERSQFLQIPNNLFFQKVLRTHSSHKPGSQATFFSRQDR